MMNNASIFNNVYSDIFGINLPSRKKVFAVGLHCIGKLLLIFLSTKGLRLHCRLTAF